MLTLLQLHPWATLTHAAITALRAVAAPRLSTAPWTQRPPESTPDEQSHPGAKISTQNDTRPSRRPGNRATKDSGWAPTCLN